MLKNAQLDDGHTDIEPISSAQAPTAGAGSGSGGGLGGPALNGVGGGSGAARQRRPHKLLEYRCNRWGGKGGCPARGAGPATPPSPSLGTTKPREPPPPLLSPSIQ